MPAEDEIRGQLKWFYERHARHTEEAQAEEAREDKAQSLASERRKSWSSTLKALSHMAHSYELLAIETTHDSASISTLLGGGEHQAIFAQSEQGDVDIFFQKKDDQLAKQQGFSSPDEHRRCPLKWTPEDVILLALKGLRKEISRPGSDDQPALVLRTRTAANVMIELASEAPEAGGVDIYITAPATSPFTRKPLPESYRRPTPAAQRDCPPHLVSAERYLATNSQGSPERILLCILPNRAIWLRKFDKNGKTLDVDYKVVPFSWPPA